MKARNAVKKEVDGKEVEVDLTLEQKAAKALRSGARRLSRQEIMNAALEELREAEEERKYAAQAGVA